MFTWKSHWQSWRVLTLAALLGVAAPTLGTCLGAERDEAKKGKVRKVEAKLPGRPVARTEDRIRKALAEPTTIEFIEAPLKDVIDYLKDVHQIEIQIDTKALDGVGVSSDTPVTRNLKGVSLRSALTLMLKDLDLTIVIRDEVLQITTPEVVESDLTFKTYVVADIATDKASSTALISAIELALGPPAEEVEARKLARKVFSAKAVAAVGKGPASPDQPDAATPLPSTPRVVDVRGLLVVRGNSLDHERVEELLMQIRRGLDASSKAPAGKAPQKSP